MDRDQNNVAQRIADAFKASDLEAEAAGQIAFHLTDCRGDIEEICKLYNQGESMDEDQILAIIFKFLAHAPNHLAAAKKLAGVGPIEDVFGVGVLEEDED